MTLSERIAAQRARGTEPVRNVQEMAPSAAEASARPEWMRRTIDTRGPIRARRDETGRLLG